MAPAGTEMLLGGEQVKTTFHKKKFEEKAPKLILKKQKRNYGKRFRKEVLS